MKIEIDEEACIGCGACQAVAEEYFDIVDGKAKAMKDAVAGEDEDKVKEAASVCPVNAIKLEDY